jgi:pyruvate dehydrogenase E2 component (dihydrolipoamide acetyltransferase)
MATEFFIHKMSEHMDAAQILRWCVREGDHVEKFQIILEVMTDKVNAEVEAPVAGVIKGIRAGAVEGVSVAVGEPLCYIAAPGESVPDLPPLREYPAISASAIAPPVPTPEDALNAHRRASDVSSIRATPAARRIAKVLGVDIAEILGTGPLGRISEMDVRSYAAAHPKRA